MAEIKTSELEELIKKKMVENGLTETEINEDTVEKIKNKIKEAVNAGKQPAQNTQPNDVVVDVSQDTPTDTPGEIPPAVTQDVIVDTTSVEQSKKEGELEEKERQIQQKEQELANKEAELNRKEEELKFKPELPKQIEEVGPEQVFVFNKDEISLGAEALSKNPFRLVSNPDSKKSMFELWKDEAKKSAEVYVVKFEKLGDFNFDPFNGTTSFIEIPPQELGMSNQTETQGIDKALEQSQENLSDKIEPVKDVTLPMNPNGDMGLKTVDVERIIQSRVDDMLKNYIQNKFQQ